MSSQVVPIGGFRGLPFDDGSFIVALSTFGPAATDIRCVRRDFNFRYRSTAHWIDVFRNFYGPTHKAYAALDPARQARLTEDITAPLESLNVGGAKSLVVSGEYLEVVITKK